MQLTTVDSGLEESRLLEKKATHPRITSISSNLRHKRLRFNYLFRDYFSYEGPCAVNWAKWMFYVLSLVKLSLVNLVVMAQPEGS